MPFFNWFYKKIKYARKKFIIDIPPMPKDKQERIMRIVGAFAADVIAKSVAEMAKEARDGR
ncbi:hypothetical protein ACFL3D_01870 [Candidatus Omnitrophota bacterium]